MQAKHLILLLKELPPDTVITARNKETGLLDPVKVVVVMNAHKLRDNSGRYIDTSEPSYIIAVIV